MIKLPLLTVFPFEFEGDVEPVNPFLRENFGQTSPPRPWITINNAIDFARYSAVKRGACGYLDDYIVAALESYGGQNCAWLTNMPENSRVPQILRYQTHQDNVPEMMAELQNLQTTLSPGQILFHGGHWKWDLHPGVVVSQDVPLSTSLTAVTAVCHSSNSGQQHERPFYLWVIRVGETFKAPVYFYNYYKGEQQHKHEFEVLIAPGSCMRVEHFELVQDYCLVFLVLE